MKHLLFWSILALFSTGCASIFNNSYQPVEVYTPPGTEILVDGKEPETKGGKLLLKRDKQPKQITIRQEGYMDQHVVNVPYKRSGLRFLALGPVVAGVVVLSSEERIENMGAGGILLSLGAIVTGPFIPFLDRGPKAFNYARKAAYRPKLYPEIPMHTDSMRDIQIGKVSIELEAEDDKHRVISYKEALAIRKKGEDPNPYWRSGQDQVSVDRTIFEESLNEILQAQSYIDTTNKTLKNSFLNNLILNATVDEVRLTWVNHKLSYKYLFADLKISWEIKDYYGQTLVEVSTQTRSGEFPLYSSSSIFYSGPTTRSEAEALYTDVIKQVFKNGMEYGLSEVFAEIQDQGLLTNQQDLSSEEEFDPLALPTGNDYVSNLNEAIASSVTIKSEKGMAVDL